MNCPYCGTNLSGHMTADGKYACDTCELAFLENELDDAGADDADPD